MKVYRAVTLSIDTGEILSEDSYEYDGPVALAKGNNDTSANANGAYGQIGDTSGRMTSFYDTVMGQMQQRFGEQTGTMNTMMNALYGTAAGGPGQFKWDANYGGDGAGNGGGGGNGEGKDAMAGFQSGFDPANWKVDWEARGFGRTRRMMESQSTEDVAQRYQDAQDALARSASQRGTGGNMLAAIADMQSQQAAQEAAGIRNVGITVGGWKQEAARQHDELNAGIMQNREKMRFTAAQAANQWLQAEKARAAAGAARAAAGRQADAEFRARMALAGAELQSKNWQAALGFMGNVGQMQNPLPYGQLGGGILGDQMGGWSTAYGYSRPQQQQGSSWWSKLLGGLAGGAANAGNNYLNNKINGGGGGNDGGDFWSNYGGDYSEFNGGYDPSTYGPQQDPGYYYNEPSYNAPTANPDTSWFNP